MYNLGVLLAGQDPPDVGNVRAAWQKVVKARPDDTESDALGFAALGLATLDALAGDVDHSKELLDVAGQYGVPSAKTYKNALSPDTEIRSAALRILRNDPQDSEALNFIGIANYRVGERALARQHWLKSMELHDSYAPLLLYLTDSPRPADQS